MFFVQFTGIQESSSRLKKTAVPFLQNIEKKPHEPNILKKKAPVAVASLIINRNQQVPQNENKQSVEFAPECEACSINLTDQCPVEDTRFFFHWKSVGLIKVI